LRSARNPSSSRAYKGGEEPGRLTPPGTAPQAPPDRSCGVEVRPNPPAEAPGEPHTPQAQSGASFGPQTVCQCQSTLEEWRRQPGTLRRAGGHPKLSSPGLWQICRKLIYSRNCIGQHRRQRASYERVESIRPPSKISHSASPPLLSYHLPSVNIVTRWLHFPNEDNGEVRPLNWPGGHAVQQRRGGGCTCREFVPADHPRTHRFPGLTLSCLLEYEVWQPAFCRDGNVVLTASRAGRGLRFDQAFAPDSAGCCPSSIIIRAAKVFTVHIYEARQ
jgi:hypothetical protein